MAMVFTMGRTTTPASISRAWTFRAAVCFGHLSDQGMLGTDFAHALLQVTPDTGRLIDEPFVFDDCEALQARRGRDGVTGVGKSMG